LKIAYTVYATIMLQHLGDFVPVPKAPYGVPALDAAGGLRPRPPLVCSTIYIVSQKRPTFGLL